MSRRTIAPALIALLAGPILTALVGCGSGTGQLQVTLASTDISGPYSANDASTYAEYKPGDTANFAVTVVNSGPGTVSGVTLHVALPAGFHYRGTTQISPTAAARTQDLDAEVNSATPIFGLWTISPPGAAGTNPSGVEVDFSASVDASPGTATLQAYAVGDASSSQGTAAPYKVSVEAAPKLSAFVTVNPTTEARGGTVTYSVRVSNSGTGSAEDVGVLVTLPPVTAFASSITPFAGNGSRYNGTNPIKGSGIAYFDGFLLPANSSAGPGYVVIVFKASVLGGPGSAGQGSGQGSSVAPGTYGVDVQLTDTVGDIVAQHAVAPLTVT